jgi:hypothetical protein
MNKFKLSKWIRGTNRQGQSEADIAKTSQHVRHRAHRYWSRPR